jgi:site-specific recombinase XerD
MGDYQGTPDDNAEDMIAAYMEHLKASGASEATIRVKGNHLKRLHEWLPYGLAWASTSDITTWHSQPGWRQWTRRAYMVHTKTFFAWACCHGWLDGDPATDLRTPKAPALVPRPFTEHQLARALRDATGAHRLMLLLGAYEGLRCCEIAALDRQDVTEAVLYVRSGKGGDPATVPTHPIIWDAVRCLPDGPVVRNSHGRRVTPLWISKTGKAYLRSVGVHLTMHKLRHRFGTQVQEQFGDIMITKAALRHSSIKSTLGYVAVNGARVRAAIIALPMPDGPAS